MTRYVDHAAEGTSVGRCVILPGSRYTPDGFAGRVIVVAKSLGTMAAPVAAARGYDAAWLTPLLTEPDLAEPLKSPFSRRRQGTQRRLTRHDCPSGSWTFTRTE